MSTTVPVPPALRGRLAGLARRVRFLRGLRGAGLLVLCLSLVAGAALLADALCGFALPAGVRVALLAAWAVVGVTVLLRSLVAPLAARLDQADLAAAVEEVYPHLGERLITTVELAADGRVSSPALARVLAEEADARSRPLDFNRAAGRPPAALLAAACVALLALFGPAAFFPRTYATLATRFLFPWRGPTTQPEFTFEVTPGDGYVARGSVVAFTVRLTPRDERVTAPRVVRLAFTASDGAVTRHALTQDRADALLFAGGVKIPGDVEYRAEAGDAVSEAFRLTAVTPVELALEGTGVTVTPPEYARVTMETDHYPGVGDLSAFANSEAAFKLALTRPAVAAWIEFTPARDGAAVTKLPLDAKLAARMTATEPGGYRVVLEAEHGVRTVREGGKLAIRPDQPPALLKSAGLLDGRKVRAYDRLPLELRFADDVAVGAADLLWRVGDGAEREEPIRLDGAARREVSARHLFQIAGKARPGETLHYRLRFRDTRPERYGGPNVVHHPENGTLKLEVVSEGKSPREEEILARRDEIDGKIAEVQAAIKQEMRAGDKVRAETRGKQDLTPAQRQQVERVRQLNRDVQSSLDDLAALARREPETAILGDKAKQIGNEEMKKAGDELARTLEEKAAPAAREERFRAAERELHQALNRLDDLKADNARVARDRVDQAKVEELADKQKQLAEKAAELDTDTPEGKAAAEDIKREQRKTEEELAKLAEKSELLKKAFEEERAEQARREAEKAAELAKEQRALAKAAAETERRRERERLAELATRQEELAARAKKLSEETARRLEADRALPFDDAVAKKAAEALAGGEAERAQAEQENAARALDSLARHLDCLAASSKDGREAARQLALMQEGLAKRTKGAKLDDAAKKGLVAEQKALREALEGISLPPADRAALGAWSRARQQMDEAEKALMAGKQDEAAKAMESARDALRKLTGLLPSLEGRKKSALAEVDRVRRQQEELARELDDALRSAKPEARLNEVRRKQEALAEKMRSLDAPGEEARRERAREEMAEAARDLRDRRADDARVDQARARKELDRLAQALAGKTPADEKAAELARRQRELLAEKDTAKDEVKRRQRDLAAELEKLGTKDAPAARREAERAVKEAASGGRAKMEEAAKKLEALAEALKDEGDARKAQRLAKSQAEAAEKAKRDGPKADDRQRLEALAEELKNLRGGDAAKEKKAARDAVAKAEKAKPEERAKAEGEAAEALKKLADKLGPAEAPKTAEAKKEGPLGDRKMADEARKLAKEQRELRDETKRKMEDGKGEAPGKSEAGKLAKEQAEIAKEAEKLAGAVKGEQGEKSAARKQADAASKAAGEAARGLSSGALEEASKGGEQSEKALRELAKSLKDTPRATKDGDTFEEARKLARRQAEVNKQLAPMAKDPAAQRAAQAERQAELEKQAGELAKRLDRMAERPSPTPGAEDAARQGADAARGAKEAMRQAGEMAKRGDPAAEARERAAKALERAAAMADRSSGKGVNEPVDGKAGKELGDAGRRMEEAGREMARGGPRDASKAMAQAGDALQRAAEALARAMQPQGQEGRPTDTPPNELGGAVGGGKPDDRAVAMPKLPFDPRKWGELPGELKTKITQEMRAKYGDDYARMIKLYFEQLADTKKKR